MSFSESFINILIVQALFGLTPFRYNESSKRFELKLLNIIQSFGSYLMISITVIILTIIYRYPDGETNLANTANVTVFSQDIVLVTMYNVAMINWFLIRRDHINFLNKFIEMDTKLKVKLNISVVTPPMYYRKSFYLQISIIVFCIFLISNQIVRDVFTERFEWSISILNITFGTQIVAQMLTIFYIGCLAGALNKCFEVVFIKMSEITNVQQEIQQQMNKDLVVCVNLFDELISLKSNFSQLFGHQLLLIFLFEFVNLTISVYFILVYLVENQSLLTSMYLLFLFVIPHLSMFVCLIRYMQQLADVVSSIKKIIPSQFTNLENLQSGLSNDCSNY